MRRFILLATAMAILLALAGPASAKVKTRDAEGVTEFTLVASCEPFVDCVIEDGFLFASLQNPGTKTGTFKGTQLYTVDFVLNLADFSFTVEGSVVFTGTVKACGHGTVIFDVIGSGFLEADGTANFVVQDQTVSGGTLPLQGTISETGTGTTNSDGTGSIDYVGSYTCDQRGRGHSS